MTDLLYLTDSYLREFEARVVRSDGSGVVLDRTAFYPRGGGQPSDHGTLATEDGTEYAVRDLKRIDDRLFHVLARQGEGNKTSESRHGNENAEPHTDSNAGGSDHSGGDMRPEVDAAVRGIIDWNRRFTLMRTHTAMHMLSGIIFQEFGARVTGGNMEPGKGRLDFELESLDREVLPSIEARLNDEVAAAREIEIYQLPRDEAMNIPDLIRTKINLLPAGITEIRIVDIKGLDLQADGGTHVANTREVGEVRIVGYKSKGKINKRLQIALADLV